MFGRIIRWFFAIIEFPKGGATVAKKERKEGVSQGVPEELFHGPARHERAQPGDLTQKSPLRIVESVTTQSVSEEPKRYE